MDSLKNIDRNELLGMLGLQMKTTPVDYVLPALAVFGAGLVVGASLGILFAPRAGRETREEISRRIQHAPEALARIPERAAELTHKAGEAIQGAREHARETTDRVRDQAT